MPGSAVGLDEVSRIAQLTDPVIRNLAITVAYHDFANRLAVHLGPDVTWCGFAVWASKTAGVSIRGETIGRMVDDALFRDPDYHDLFTSAMRRFRPLERFHVAGALRHTCVVDAMVDVTRDVSVAVSSGNALVFDELGPMFAVFLDAAPDRDAMVAAVAGVPGCTPELLSAFECYADAMRADGERRAQLVLAGNLLAVAHEQQRLQPAIAAALDCAIDDIDLGDRVLGFCPTLLKPLVLRYVAGPLDRVENACQRAWEEVATHLLMRLVTADEELSLAERIPPLPGGASYPPALEELTEARSIETWERWARTDHACDWVVMEQRMGFIAELFRSRQQHPPLLHPPYTPAQLAVIAAGGRPEPPL